MIGYERKQFERLSCYAVVRQQREADVSRAVSICDSDIAEVALVDLLVVLNEAQVRVHLRDDGCWRTAAAR